MINQDRNIETIQIKSRTTYIFYAAHSRSGMKRTKCMLMPTKRDVILSELERIMCEIIQEEKIDIIYGVLKPPSINHNLTLFCQELLKSLDCQKELTYYIDENVSITLTTSMLPHDHNHSNLRYLMILYETKNENYRTPLPSKFPEEAERMLRKRKTPKL